MISIIGPSGTGKSTFLRCLNRLETPDGGSIVVGGVDVTAPKVDLAAVRRKMGMVFQNFNLFGDHTVLGNVMAAPCDLLKVPAEEAKRKALELLDRVGFADKAEALPDELSGGQKQRVAIARALAMDPEILHFDFPYSKLKTPPQEFIFAPLKAWVKAGLTIRTDRPLIYQLALIYHLLKPTGQKAFDREAWKGDVCNHFSTLPPTIENRVRGYIEFPKDAKSSPLWE